ncbi:MAG TPA: biopolymer transporter ExbD, partial [Terriglobales bacterium]
MALALRNEGSKVNSDINVTPMVDVMLVLLIIFMVVTPMLQKGVSVDLAKVNNPQQMPDADKEDALIVAVMRDGKVYFGNDVTAVDQLTNKVK